MRDWKNFVRERLGAEGVESAEVVAELAAHLEDVCENDLARGSSGGEAEKRALASIRWRELARGIREAKEDGMEDRKKSLLLPMFANLLILTLGIQALLFFGIHPEPAAGSRVWFSFPLAWLLALPLSGAVGAYLAKREGGSTTERLVAGMAPSLVWLGEFCVMAVAFAWERREFAAAFPINHFGLTAVWWVLLPTLAQFAGTAPFLGDKQSMRVQA
jgi:hypothetical protein